MSTGFGGAYTKKMGEKTKEIEMSKIDGPESFGKAVEKRMKKKMEGEQSGGIHIDINSHDTEEEPGKDKSGVKMKKLAHNEYPTAKVESEIRQAISAIARKYNARADVHTSTQGGGTRVSIDGDIFFD